MVGEKLETEEELQLEISGKPKPLKGNSTLTIENPDAPVNLGGEYVDVDGVMIAKELLEGEQK